MKVIGHTERGVILEASNDEFMRLCGFEYPAAFDHYLTSRDKDAPAGIFSDSRTKPRIGVELPVGDWHRQLRNLRDLADTLLGAANKFRDFAETTEATVKLLDAPPASPESVA